MVGLQLNRALKLEWALKGSYLGMTENSTERGCAALVLILLLKKLHHYQYNMILTILARAKPPNFQVTLAELTENSTLTMCSQSHGKLTHYSEFWLYLIHKVGEGFNKCLFT